jgi:hypothetical protein
MKPHPIAREQAKALNSQAGDGDRHANLVQ